MEATATACGHEPPVEPSEWSHGGHYHVPETAGVDVAASHDLHHGKRARDQLARNVSHGRQRPGERKELLLRRLL